MNARKWLSYAGLVAISLYALSAGAEDEGRTFDRGSVRGNYTFLFDGMASPTGSPGPVMVHVAATGRFRSDGNGLISEGFRALNVGGLVILEETFECTYDVRPEGIGTAECRIRETNQIETFTVSLISSKEFNFIGTRLGTVVAGVAKKQ